MDVLALLKRSHSLRELDYYCSEEPDSEWSSNIATQVSHPYLDSVKFGVVKADYDQAWLHFLNLLTLKGIHSLTVKGSSPQAVPITWVQSISQLVLRSGCQLKHLDLLNLENSFTSELDLLHLFSLIPEVTHLSFCVSCSDCTFTDLFFTSLTIATTTAEILLPNLAELSIDIREDVEGAKNTVPKSSLPRADTVVSMAESRRDQESAFDAGLIGHRRSVASLQVFTFRLTSLRYGRRLIKPKKLRWKVDTRSESRILALKEAGMGITVQGT
ncbi:hypothetical protein BT96DRAFT_914735 [Gymnopus androsaceus JB14]|uniref:RNI-like protein n=1 Tax=Gymnopus androsaceus JB14 TaxID=1447944 RepID=A0A6A4IED7_9AGAR|nr:hypothetical protein BT96DRAFT_914735 [Gymnopus androsaceus JB14]